LALYFIVSIYNSIKPDTPANGIHNYSIIVFRSLMADTCCYLWFPRTIHYRW